MEVKQVATLVNNAAKEALGQESIVAEDLGNVVDAGSAVFNSSAVEPFAKALVNHVGRMVFVDRPYAGNTPSLLRDSWEYGAVLEKISAKIPEATETEDWQLIDGASYDPHVFHAPNVSAKFFEKRVTFEVDASFTSNQLKQSFTSAAQLNGFTSMLYNVIEKSMTLRIDSLAMRALNNQIAETIHADFGSSSLSGGSGIKAVNLLYLYNQRYSENLSAANAITDPDFIRYAAYIIGTYSSRLTKLSSLFNVGGEDRFTPAGLQNMIFLSDFRRAADVFLQSDTFHDQFTRLPAAEEVPYWQGSGTGYSFTDISTINVTTVGGSSVEASGILGVLFDRDAVAVTNFDRRVTTSYNPKADFYNEFFKFDAGYFVDSNENFVVFFVA